MSENKDIIKDRAKELVEKFGGKASDVVDEIMSEILNFDTGLRYFYEAVKEEIKKQ